MSAAALRAPAGDRLRRPLVTPEGVELQLRLGSAGERVGAFLLDALILLGTLLAVTVGAAVLAIGFEATGFAAAIWIVGFFALRNLYFAGFELGARAATPGKRLLGLRVVPQGGGRLTADAVLARNLMREIEIFLPLTLIAWSGTGGTPAVVLAGLAWSGLFALFPLFNRDRMRVGDLVAGTWVVELPRRVLLPDLLPEPGRTPGREGPAFTVAELDAYGVRELQALEQVLRARNPATMALVAQRIRGRIGRAEGRAAGPEADAAFLEAFYAGLRRRLEGGLRFGRRRRDKYDAG